VAGVVTLGASGYGGPGIGTPILIAVGAPFVVAFGLNPRQHWWALIPAWVMGVLAGLLWFVDRVQGEVVGAFVMFAIGLPFLLVYAIDRTRWWALIPGGVLAGLGVVVLLTTQVSGETIGTVVLLIIALPFLAVYAASPNHNWWALIPAGILASTAVMVLFVAGRELSADMGARLSGILFLGAAATFGLLWLRRNTVPTAWAVYPAGALAILALLAFALGTAIELVWPVVLIGLGLLLLVASLRPRQQH
jgi:hypothetical protein